MSRDIPSKHHQAQALLSHAIQHEFAGRIALVSSFGAESAVLLHMVAQINPATAVLFNDTGQLFAETRRYQWQLAHHLGLSRVRIIRPTMADLASTDPNGDLFDTAPDRCCGLRKVEPMARALAVYDAWITGRKRHQNAQRNALAERETDDHGRVKLNPLADWSAEDLRGYMQQHTLPAHPLVAKGYPSIGCAPCTSPVAQGEDPRAGRWRGQAKTECGLHLTSDAA